MSSKHHWLTPRAVILALVYTGSFPVLTITGSRVETFRDFLPTPFALPVIVATAIMGGVMGLITAWTWWRVVQQQWPGDTSGFWRRKGLLFSGFIWLALPLGPLFSNDFSVADLFRYGNLQARVMMNLLVAAPVSLWAGYWWAKTMGGVMGPGRRGS